MARAHGQESGSSSVRLQQEDTPNAEQHQLDPAIQCTQIEHKGHAEAPCTCVTQAGHRNLPLRITPGTCSSNSSSLIRRIVASRTSLLATEPIEYCAQRQGGNVQYMKGA